MTEPTIDFDAESVVLSAMVYRGFDDRRLAAEHFGSPDCRTIFLSIREMQRAGVPVDCVTVTKYVRANSGMEAHVLFGILDERLDSGIRCDVEHQCRELDGKRLLREKTRLAGGDYSIRELRDKLDALKPAFASAGNTVSGRKVALDWLDECERRQRGEVDDRGLTTGIDKLDDCINGMKGARLIVVAARPGIGKTALLGNIAFNLLREGKKVAFFSIEMTRDQLIDRGVAQLSGVPIANFRRQRGLTGIDYKRVHEAVGWFGTDNFRVNTSSRITMAEIEAELEELDDPPDAVFVDYLQIIDPEDSADKRHLQVGQISRDLKALSKRRDIPVITAAQVNRGIDTGKKLRRPRMADLRESGSIEQDADIILFLHEEVDLDAPPNTDPSEIRKMEVIVAKNRDGQRDVRIDVDFVPETTGFSQSKDQFD